MKQIVRTDGMGRPGVCVWLFFCEFTECTTALPLGGSISRHDTVGRMVDLAQWSQATLETSRHPKPQGQALEGLTWPLTDLILSALLIHRALPSHCDEEAEVLSIAWQHLVQRKDHL